MDHAHVPSPLLSWLVLGLLGVAMVVYLAAASRMLRRGKRWSAWRCICWVVGVALLMIALSPATLQAARREFSGHMLQHLLIGMYAPLALTLAAPLTLTLATLAARARRPLGQALRSPPIRVLAHPATAAILNIGGMFALYLTPLYAVMERHIAVHFLVMLHFLLAGYLFTWSIAGQDAAPGRPPLGVRLIVLLVAAGAHATLSKLMYAHGWPREHTLSDIKAGAELMYYGGDVAELLLATILFAGWYRTRGRQHERRLRLQPQPE